MGIIENIINKWQKWFISNRNDDEVISWLLNLNFLIKSSKVHLITTRQCEQITRKKESTETVGTMIKNEWMTVLSSTKQVFWMKNKENKVPGRIYHHFYYSSIGTVPLEMTISRALPQCSSSLTLERFLRKFINLRLLMTNCKHTTDHFPVFYKQLLISKNVHFSQKFNSC